MIHEDYVVVLFGLDIWKFVSCSWKDLIMGDSSDIQVEPAALFPCPIPDQGIVDLHFILFCEVPSAVVTQCSVEILLRYIWLPMVFGEPSLVKVIGARLAAILS